jgi:hypothetical protein
MRRRQGLGAVPAGSTYNTSGILSGSAEFHAAMQTVADADRTFMAWIDRSFSAGDLSSVLAFDTAWLTVIRSLPGGSDAFGGFASQSAADFQAGVNARYTGAASSAAEATAQQAAAAAANLQYQATAPVVISATQGSTGTTYVSPEQADAIGTVELLNQALLAGGYLPAGYALPSWVFDALPAGYIIPDPLATALRATAAGNRYPPLPGVQVTYAPGETTEGGGLHYTDTPSNGGGGGGGGYMPGASVGTDETGEGSPAASAFVFSPLLAVAALVGVWFLADRKRK